ncbi:Uncharacterised protein [Mycobacteroides abscessus subsp. abscessus]|nr:Uncharacterised protein [Mycobacteroides abscessus subsp. abscessus]SIN43975.1 Uncharacterised protein [Mycobacteroides abscessus subsp. abscessus]
MLAPSWKLPATNRFGCSSVIQLNDNAGIRFERMNPSRPNRFPFRKSLMISIMSPMIGML